MRVYYNEIDKFCCDWLQQLMDAGQISPGKIDNRSIEDVNPEDLKQYDWCHFFAGIGIWNLSLNRAGWKGPVWTGSCPCQPFSAAGKGAGFTDERHLWPAFFHLIETCRPQCVLGEQVASKDGLAWLDLVQTDLEGADYTAGAVDICAAGFGAPHIRQRLYWVAYAADARRNEARQHGSGSSPLSARPEQCCGSCGLEHTTDTGLEGCAGSRCDREGQLRKLASERRESDGLADSEHRAESEGSRQARREAGERTPERGRPGWNGESSRLANTTSVRLESMHTLPGSDGAGSCGTCDSGPRRGTFEQSERTSNANRALPTNGLWRDPDWLYCRDNKWRPVEPATFPLAPIGTFSNRVAELRGAGNTLTLGAAQSFVEVVMEELGR